MNFQICNLLVRLSLESMSRDEEGMMRDDIHQCKSINRYDTSTIDCSSWLLKDRVILVLCFIGPQLHLIKMKYFN